MWLAGLASAITIKLTSSIDDVVWLAPFLTSNVSTTMRVQNTMVYISVCLVQTVVAMFIAYGGNKTVDYLMEGSSSRWSSDKILTVAAGVLLALYAIKLTIEYIQELQEGATDEGAHAGNAPEAEEKRQPEARPLSARSRDIEMGEIRAETTQDEECANQDLLPDEDRKAHARQQTLFVIAFIGSIDDLTLFVPMLVGKAFDVVQLTFGAFIAASGIVLVCIFIGLCKPIANFLSNIPLALIVIIFAFSLLVRGFTMD
mmetsp:Transcript_65713/g.182940  ORF Transcript_65713/g.182940 Transcript_65713/m.182940 type:complete len:258 (+) Transcript_65713:201-974(+)